MLTLVVGGRGSGKSEYAEKQICKLQGELRYYIATMEPFGEEAKIRIERHRSLREGKGFLTVEKTCGLGTLELSNAKQADVLLEDLSNLLANELWGSPELEERLWRDDFIEEMLQDIGQLSKECRNLVIVSNMIDADGEAPTEDMARYAKLLGELNCGVARMADRVVEVVCGIPVEVKEEENENY